MYLYTFSYGQEEIEYLEMLFVYHQSATTTAHVQVAKDNATRWRQYVTLDAKKRKEKEEEEEN